MTSPPLSAERRTALRADAGSLYARQLAADPAAQDYLAARGISIALARRLGLGAAGHGWTGAVDQLRARGYTDTELVTSGVGFRSSRGTVVDTSAAASCSPPMTSRAYWSAGPAGPRLAPRSRPLAGSTAPPGTTAKPSCCTGCTKAGSGWLGGRRRFYARASLTRTPSPSPPKERA
jgi:hypothetical protein